jgi:murein DD-endopeptidase MepM/ murein hydrolase activator NlpD
MASRHHTIIFVPHERAKFRKWRVTSFHVVGALTVFAGITAVATFATWSFFSSSVNHAEVERLRSENAQLRTLAGSFEGSVQKLESQLTDYEGRTRKLAIVAGIESFGTTNEAGIGGPDVVGTGANAASESPSLDELAARVSSLASNLDAVDDKLVERGEMISSLPAIAPVRGILTSGFGSRPDPINGRAAYHRAIDIAAPPGKPVHATADGIVIKAEYDHGLGNCVYVAHGFGITTRYGHMSRFGVQPGQKVKRGDVVGYVGNTGRSTGFHLHYEVLVNGESVNPLGYILDAANDPS